jgi:hypothetical protein
MDITFYLPLILSCGLPQSSPLRSGKSGYVAAKQQTPKNTCWRTLLFPYFAACLLLKWPVTMSSLCALSLTIVLALALKSFEGVQLFRLLLTLARKSHLQQEVTSKATIHILSSGDSISIWIVISTAKRGTGFDLPRGRTTSAARGMARPTTIASKKTSPLELVSPQQPWLFKRFPSKRCSVRVTQQTSSILESILLCSRSINLTTLLRLQAS